MKMVISDAEYDKLIKRIEFFDATRNKLLTFSFTAVLTIMGVALTVKMNRISVWICLIPFFLIIPFTARITYYRLASAHISSFLRMFAKENMQFEIGAQVVTENIFLLYPQIAWLVNHEMVLLGVATGCIFYIKYITCTRTFTYFNFVVLSVPVFLCTLVYLISHTTHSYQKLLKKFTEKWKFYYEQ